MRADRRTKEKDTKYAAILFIVIALALITNAIRDLNQLQDYSSTVHSLVAGLFENEETRIYKRKDVVTASSGEAGLLDQDPSRSQEFRWAGVVAAGRTVEIKGINGDIKAEPAAGAQVEVIAVKTARRSDPALVELRVLEHGDGVTICVVYPSDDPGNPNTCEPCPAGRMSVRDNDVKVDIRVNVPAGVNFNGKTVNGEIDARSISGNVDLSTVNGSIKISTSGYARAKTVNGEIAATLGNTDWLEKLEFKTVNGGITLDLPAHTSTDIKADTFNGSISSDFQLATVSRMTKRHLSGTIGSGGRELILKTLNGSIKLRRAS